VSFPYAAAEIELALKRWVAAKMPLWQQEYLAIVHVLAGSFIPAHL